MNGPVSSQLSREVADLVRQFGLVVWLDPADQYSGFVDALDAPYPVVRYRGSFVRALRDARGFAAGTGPEPLLLHVPGLDLAAVERSPLLELAAAGHRWSKDLRALVTAAAAGRVAPAALSAFTESIGSLASADAWLADRLADAEGGLAAALRGVSLAELVDQLLDGGALAARVGHPDELAALWAHLHHRTGLPEAWWRPLCPPDGRFAPHDVAFALAGWAMSVEYMHDPRPRTAKAAALAPAQGLPEPLVDACRQLAATLRERRGDFYQATADETEARIAAERAVAPESLGHVDTFRFEEDALLREAIRRLDPDSARPDAWDFAIALAEGRSERSFWLRRDRRRGMAWRLVLDAARLCRAIARAGEQLPPGDLDDAARWYASAGAPVDRCHRVLLQDQALLLTSELPEFEALDEALAQARSAWASWARTIAAATSRRCAAQGFLPEPAMQQRTIFDDLVTQASEKTAYFMVDALRYEMGEALRAALEGPGVTTALSPRLAELPSVTEVGMNVLAPVSRNGKLQPAISDGKVSGFRVGEFQVRDPKTRQRAIQERVGGATCPWLTLQEVVSDSVTTLRQRVARAQVVVVHSQEIDQAGEGGLGLSAFETALHQLREACVRLRAAGVRRLVITADHGFLLLEKSDSVQHGTRREPSRRHAFSPVAADHAHEVRVPLAALGYDGATGHLMMPDGLQVFDTGRRDQTFVHGGPSLQERVIPVLVVTAAPDPQARPRVVLRVTPGGVMPGMHRAVLTVEPPSGELFADIDAVDVVLRPLDAPGVVLAMWVGSEAVAGAARLPIGQATEVFFTLSADVAGKVAVQAATGGDVDAQPVLVGYFGVSPTTKETEAPRAPSDQGVRSWLAGIGDPGHRQVLEHLSVHGMITEAEVAKMLGGASKARRFDNALAALVPPTAPMKVRTDSSNGMKRYVKEAE